MTHFNGKRPSRKLRALPALISAALVWAVLSGYASTPATPPTALTPPAVTLPSPTPVPEDATSELAFARWVTAFRAQARSAGISDATLQTALDGVRWLPRVVESDRTQPEFTRPVWDYLDRAVSPQRVTLGQRKLLAYRREADAAAARYGVPAAILGAIWGVESNFGSHVGDIAVIDALATLGFDGRREAWARGQLLNALQILQAGDIDREHMMGSWAGAMGQTQFIPSAFLAYAVDADGDGRRDIWGSMADVLASTANFIAQSGWQSGQAWGTEVRLPVGFDVGRSAERLSSSQWAELGVNSATGGPLPDLAGGASILLPAGVRGPAFMVGPNFRVILRYNNATSYALAVCLLAQRLDSGPGVQAAWPRDVRPLNRSEVLALQKALNQRGFATGTPDGVMGPATQQGLRQFQRSEGLPPDGFADLGLLERVRASLAE